MSNKLLPCPFCGGEAIMRERFIHGSANTKHYRLECKDCHASFLNWNKNTSKAIAAWNRRAEPESNPLTLDELRQMDGEPVYIVESPDWGHWELSYDAEDYIQDRDEDFYGMTCNAVKDGWCSGTCKYGLHNMGWLAYRSKPKEEV